MGKFCRRARHHHLLICSGGHRELRELSGGHRELRELSGGHRELRELSGGHRELRELSGGHREMSGGHREMSGGHKVLCRGCSLHLLLAFRPLKDPPHTRDWTTVEVEVRPPSYVGTLRRSLDQLEETLNMEKKKLHDAELKRVQRKGGSLEEATPPQDKKKRRQDAENFGFDSLKYMNHDMEEKGIVGRECIPLEPCFPPPRQRSALITAS
ncbi:unnamed protein product [Boreogadus saida]